MILVITHKERNKRTGQMETIVSHGIDLETDQPVILPNETPQSIGAVFDREYGEFVLQGRNRK